jgi:hypothetical protein
MRFFICCDIIRSMTEQLGQTPDYHKYEGDRLTRQYGFKLLRYPCSSKLGANGEFPFSDQDGVIAYRMFPESKAVIYTGLTNKGQSTMRVAGEIIALIKKQEGELEGFRIFDAQTNYGYPNTKLRILEVTVDENNIPEFNRTNPSDLPRDFFLD